MKAAWHTLHERERDGEAILDNWRQKLVDILGGVSYKHKQRESLVKALADSLNKAQDGDLTLDTSEINSTTFFTDREKVIQHLNTFKTLKVTNMTIDEWRKTMSEFWKVARVREIINSISSKEMTLKHSCDKHLKLLCHNHSNN